jgi:hypothetical protein
MGWTTMTTILNTMNMKEINQASDIAWSLMSQFDEDRIAKDAELLADVKNDVAMLRTDWAQKVAEIFKIVFQKRIQIGVEILYKVPETENKKSGYKEGGESITIGPMGFGMRSSYDSRSDYDIRESNLKLMIANKERICNALRMRMKKDLANDLENFLTIVSVIPMESRYERKEDKTILKFKIKNTLVPDYNSLRVAYEMLFLATGDFQLKCQGEKDCGDNEILFEIDDVYKNKVVYGQIRDEFLENLPKMSKGAKDIWVKEKEAIDKLNDTFGKELLLANI